MFQVSERCVCWALGQPRSTQRYRCRQKDGEELLTERIVMLVSQFGRYGYCRITAMLQLEGWRVNHKRIERIWPQEGLKVPKKQPKRGRLWLNDGSCLRLRPEYPDHVWSYDYMLERTHDGRAFRILNVIDEYTRECLAIRVARKLTHEDVQECLAELFCLRGVPTAQIMVPSSSPNGCVSGWTDWRYALCSSSPAVPGRAATSSHSMASCVTNCSIARSFSRWKNLKP